MSYFIPPSWCSRSISGELQSSDQKTWNIIVAIMITHTAHYIIITHHHTYCLGCNAPLLLKFYVIFTKNRFVWGTILLGGKEFVLPCMLTVFVLFDCRDSVLACSYCGSSLFALSGGHSHASRQLPCQRSSFGLGAPRLNFRCVVAIGLALYTCGRRALRRTSEAPARQASNTSRFCRGQKRAISPHRSVGGFPYVYT